MTNWDNKFNSYKFNSHTSRHFVLQEKVVDEDEFVVGSGGDYYTLLGVSREADETEIKNAYRKLARENHPGPYVVFMKLKKLLLKFLDKNLDDDESVNRFKQIGFAYSVLSDPIKRRQYNLLFVGNVGKKCKTGKIVIIKSDVIVYIFFY